MLEGSLELGIHELESNHTVARSLGLFGERQHDNVFLLSHHAISYELPESG